MTARATTAWEASLDPGLVARLARPLRRPGLVSLAIVRRIHGGVEALLGRLSLLARFAHKVRELAALATPIVHARGVGAVAETAPIREERAQPPIVRAVERTIIVETRSRAEPGETRASRPGGAEVSRTAGEVRGPAPAPARLEIASAGVVVPTEPMSERRETRPPYETIEMVRRVERIERIESVVAGSPSAWGASNEPMEPAAPIVRRSRMGAPIVRRDMEPRDPPALIERITPPLRNVAATTGLPEKAPEAVAVVITPSGSAASREPVAPVRPIVMARQPARAAGRGDVVEARRSSAAPSGVPVVHAVSGSRAPVAPDAPRATEPVVRPRVRATRPELELPLAHAAPRLQATGVVRPGAAVAVPAPTPPPVIRRVPTVSPPSSTKIDLQDLADHVQRILARRAMQERERRGLPR